MRPVNTTPLSNFAVIGRLDLLIAGLDNLSPITTIYVRQEFLRGVKKGLFRESNIQWLEIVKLSSKEEIIYQNLCQRFGKGEASCLAIALERKITLATDDMKARKLILQFGGSVIGTLGILKRLTDKGILTITEGDKILGFMINEGYFSPIKTLLELEKL